MRLHCSRESAGWDSHTAQFDVHHGRIHVGHALIFVYLSDVEPGEGGLLVVCVTRFPPDRLLVPLPAVSWPWVPAWGSLEPSRQGGENAQKNGKKGEEMGEIRPKKCEPRELTKDQPQRSLVRARGWARGWGARSHLYGR